MDLDACRGRLATGVSVNGCGGSSSCGEGFPSLISACSGRSSLHRGQVCVSSDS